MRGRIVDPVKPVKRARLAEKEEEQHEDLSIKARLKQVIREQEHAFVRLVEERRSQVRRIEDQSRDIQAQLVEAQRKLAEAEAQLASLRDRNSLNGYSGGSLATPLEDEPVKVKVEPGGGKNYEEKKHVNESHSSRKPVLVNSGSRPNGGFVNDTRVSSAVTKTIDSNSGVSKSSFSDPTAVHVKSESGSSSAINPENKASGSDPKEHADLVLHVGGSMAPSFLNVLHHRYFPSQHKRKLRSLTINSNPTSDQMFATSALDGVINAWKVQDKGEGISLVGSVHCLSSGQRRWPEELTWHPSGESIFACYSADGKDDQVAIINPSFNGKIIFLKDKPHEKGIINSLVFLPWKERTFFATGGCDHGVVLWKEGGDHWKAETLHRSLHSSAVMGAAGMQHKPLIVSVGLDKRIVGFDTDHGREDFRYQLDSKALGILPNPVDQNLYMVQTGTPGQQLRLFDVRMQRAELYAFGWRQESTESQSALINQSWSSDGFYIASGSADPKIHVFDIRYNSKEPSQSIKAHQKRVFKAVWHNTLPLLISISSDLNIGLLKLSM